jgi:hypothetical protein
MQRWKNKCKDADTRRNTHKKRRETCVNDHVRKGTTLPQAKNKTPKQAKPGYIPKHERKNLKMLPAPAITAFPFLPVLYAM